MTNLDSPTLTEAYAGLRDGSFSAVELLRSVYDRFQQTEPVIRAWVELDADQAAAHAMVADRRLQASQNPPPLLGIPVGIKDIFDVAGVPTRCSSRLRRDVAVATHDAEAVLRLRAAGAILLGKTVTQEFAAGVVSSPARNPWNPDRVPGGSSGGSAAAVAAGSAIAALGSDTGGSIRIPASVTGTVGLKPTLGRVSTMGVYPLSPSLDTAGPITRSVADAAALYLVLTNRRADMATHIDRFMAAATAPTLAGTRIGVLGGFFAERLQPGVEQAFGGAVAAFRGLGAEIVDVDWTDAAAARSAAMLISRVESAVVHRDALRGSPDLFGDDVRLRFEVGALLPADTLLQARRTRVAVRDSIAALFREHRLDAVVAPTTPATAPSVDRLEADYPDGTVESVGTALTRFTMPWNATGQPVVSVPCGFDDDGMPVGLSFVGRPDEELPLCMLAHAFEQSTDWHRQSPMIGRGNGMQHGRSDQG